MGRSIGLPGGADRGIAQGPRWQQFGFLAQEARFVG
jgi:hypothetical protein